MICQIGLIYTKSVKGLIAKFTVVGQNHPALEDVMKKISGRIINASVMKVAKVEEIVVQIFQKSVIKVKFIMLF